MRKSRCWTYQSANRLGSGEAIAVCSRPRNINQDCSKRGYLLAHEVPVDAHDIAESFQKIRAAHLGCRDVLPGFERVFVDPVAGGFGRAELFDVARQNLDVEHP